MIICFKVPCGGCWLDDQIPRWRGESDHQSGICGPTLKVTESDCPHQTLTSNLCWDLKLSVKSDSMVKKG